MRVSFTVRVSVRDGNTSGSSILQVQLSVTTLCEATQQRRFKTSPFSLSATFPLSYCPSNAPFLHDTASVVQVTAPSYMIIKMQ